MKTGREWLVPSCRTADSETACLLTASHSNTLTVIRLCKVPIEKMSWVLRICLEV